MEKHPKYTSDMTGLKMRHPISVNTAPILAGLFLLVSPALGTEPEEPRADKQPDQQADQQSEPQSGQQSEQETEQIVDEHADISFSAYLEGSFLSETDFDSSIGTFEYITINAGINARTKIGDAGTLSVGFDAGLINYDIKPSATSVVGDAASIGAEFDDITTLSLIGTYTDRTDEGSTWYIGGGLLSGAERDAEFGDSIDGLIAGGYLHRVNNNLEIGIGVYARTQLDDDVLIVPVPQVKYTIDQRWSISTKGAGLKVNYKSSDALTYGISGEYESVSFRLDSTHAAAPGGMVNQRGFPIAFYAQYAPNDLIQISGKVGSVIGSEIEILSTSGSEVATQDIETGVFGSIMVSFRF
jgi:hypothetical protein